MTRALYALLVAALLAPLFGPAPAIAAQTDDEIRSFLVGTWLSVRDNMPDNMLQIFRADGTSTAYFFKDATCRIVLSRINVNWSLDGGVLTLSYAEGYKDRDQVTAIDNSKMSLQSLNLDATYYQRIKSKNCLVPKG